MDKKARTGSEFTFLGKVKNDMNAPELNLKMTSVPEPVGEGRK